MNQERPQGCPHCEVLSTAFLAILIFGGTTLGITIAENERQQQSGKGYIVPTPTPTSIRIDSFPNSFNSPPELTPIPESNS